MVLVMLSEIEIIRTDIRANLIKFLFYIGKPLKIVCLISLILLTMLSITVDMRGEAQNPEPTDSTNVIDDLEEFSQKDNIFSKFVKLFFVAEDETSLVENTNNNDKKIIKKSTGKIIRNIKIVILDVFGGSILNPQDTARGWVEDIGNSLHLNTKEWLIKNMLIFSEDDVFIPYYIQESERIIRQYSYIYDVRIIPEKLLNNPDSTDVIVYVQDIWSINGGGSLSLGNKTASIFFDDINFLGFGNEFDCAIKADKRLMRGWDWDGSYSVNNIGTTFISAKLYYLSDVNLQHYGLMLDRNFISSIIDWGGGLAQHWQNTRYPDPLVTEKYARYSRQDCWLGYAFNINPTDTAFHKQNNFNIAGRITKTVFSQKPYDDTLNLFQDNIFYLGRIGYSDVTYYQDRYIFGLGRTEDVPLIKMIEFLFGYENGENYDSPYIGIRSGYSFLNENLGYIYCGLQLGSFYSKNEWVNFTTMIEMMYFSKLNVLSKWRWRHYFGSRFSYIYNPFRPTDMLNIDNENGIRGFSDDYLKGNKKIVFNYEADFFVPVKFLGFKLAIIAFADMGLISSDNNSLFLSKLYQGYGFGIRIKNEHLIFPTMQFMLGYYPNSFHTGEKPYNLYYQSTMYYKFNKFYFSMPTVVTEE